MFNYFSTIELERRSINQLRKTPLTKSESE